MAAKKVIGNDQAVSSQNRGLMELHDPNSKSLNYR